MENILTKENCAGCRLCCTFERYTVWDTPVVTPELRELILGRYRPDTAFVSREGSFLFRMEEDGEGMCRCPMLSESGCILGDDKPMDCRLWPFMVMDLAGQLTLTLSPDCPVVQCRAMGLIREAAQEIAPEAFAYAAAHPEAVRPYAPGFTVLAVENIRDEWMALLGGEE